MEKSNEKIIIESINNYIKIVKKIMSVSYIVAIIAFIIQSIFKTYYRYSRYHYSYNNYYNYYYIDDYALIISIISGIVAIALFFYTRKMEQKNNEIESVNNYIRKLKKIMNIFSKVAIIAVILFLFIIGLIYDSAIIIFIISGVNAIISSGLFFYTRKMEQKNNGIESVNNHIGILKKIMIIFYIVAVIELILFRFRISLIYDYSIYDIYDIYDRALILFIISGVVAIISTGLFFYARKMKIVVTNKRVYGQTSFGRQVDLPFDSISSIERSWLKGIAVATSSGKIRFLLISNRDDIYINISDLLIQRQETKQKKKEVINVNNSNADEIKKYKELLDVGAITQEEFDMKKKELLGL